MDIIPDSRCPIQSIRLPQYQSGFRAVDILRLDMLHPVISGNKWYKLKGNIRYALDHNYKSVLTFGGAYSNHLIAAAAAAKMYKSNAIAIVRGWHARNQLTPTLEACKEYGMKLLFVSREEYNCKTSPDYLQQLSLHFDNPFIIPEGGTNKWGREGISEIAEQIPDSYTHICVSVGSGTTLAGLRNSLSSGVKILGYVPMKQGRYMVNDIASGLYNNKQGNWQLFDDWHFGGFGKWKEELVGFMNSFYLQHSIPLDIVYTGKMMYGVLEHIKGHFFPEDASILCIHTGGLQGNSSIKEKLVY